MRFAASVATMLFCCGTIAGSASLVVAIREQLGFRLVARKAPVDVIVIDQVNITPSED